MIWRILYFYWVYSGSCYATAMEFSKHIKSPFVAVLEHIGIPAAAQIMNFIVLTAVLSCLNSGLYTNSRMLFSMAERGDAPKSFLKLNSSGVPCSSGFIWNFLRLYWSCV